MMSKWYPNKSTRSYIEDVIAISCDATKCKSPELLFSGDEFSYRIKSKKREITPTRYMVFSVMYLTMHINQMTRVIAISADTSWVTDTFDRIGTPKIGFYFGADHTTILAAMKSIDAYDAEWFLRRDVCLAILGERYPDAMFERYYTSLKSREIIEKIDASGNPLMPKITI